MNRNRCLALLALSLLASTAVAAQTSLLEFVRPSDGPNTIQDTGARAGSRGAGDPLSEEQIRTELRDRGIMAIKEWRLDGNVYRARGEWFGEPVDLHIDAATGVIKQPERLKGTQIETMLKVQGWQGVREITRGGDTFNVRAERDSRLYDLKIDSKTGIIVEWRPA